MPGFGQFKLTDALPPEHRAEGPIGAAGDGPGQFSGRSKGKPRHKGKDKDRSGGRAERGASAEPSRDRMVDIGRGNQQAGRQGGK